MIRQRHAVVQEVLSPGDDRDYLERKIALYLAHGVFADLDLPEK